MDTSPEARERFFARTGSLSASHMAPSPIRGRVFRKHKEEWYPTGVDSVQRERPDCGHGW